MRRNESASLAVFLRGVNVGGYRRFRPSALAGELPGFDIVNVGAAGTFAVRKPGSRAGFMAALRSKLPFEVEVACCQGDDLIRLEREAPFGADPPPAGVVPFLSVLSRPARHRPEVPLFIPATGDWFVHVIGSKGSLVWGFYRRQMKAIGLLGKIDDLFGAPATTRSWTTIATLLRILKSG